MSTTCNKCRVVQMGFCQIRLSSVLKLSTRESPDSATIVRNGRFTMSRYQKCPNTMSNSHWASRTSPSKTVQKLGFDEKIIKIIAKMFKLIAKRLKHYGSQRDLKKINVVLFGFFFIPILVTRKKILRGIAHQIHLLLPKLKNF